MKTTKILISLCLAIFLAGTNLNAQVTIGSTNVPHSAAVLDLQSSTKGFKLPKVALDLNNLSDFKLDGATDKATAAGLMVYNTANNTIYVWNGTVWVPMSTAAGTTAQNCPSKLFAVSVSGTIPASACPGEVISGISLTTTGGTAPYTYTSLDFNETTGVINPGVAMTSTDKVFTVKVTDSEGCFTNFTFSIPLKKSGCIAAVASPVTLPTSPSPLVFLDRNLGVQTVQTTTPDYYSPGDVANPTGYLNGDYYQWGRNSDGHEKWNSQSISGPIQAAYLDGNGQASSIYRGLFVINTFQSPFDWRDATAQNSNLWANQSTGAKNANNDPCPSGYRIPTGTELAALVNLPGLQWNESRKGYYYENGVTKFFIPAAGIRYIGGEFRFVGAFGFLWSSTATGTLSNYAVMGNGFKDAPDDGTRAGGFTIRCVKQ